MWISKIHVTIRTEALGSLGISISKGPRPETQQVGVDLKLYILWIDQHIKMFKHFFLISETVVKNRKKPRIKLKIKFNHTERLKFKTFKQKKNLKLKKLYYLLI